MFLHELMGYFTWLELSNGFLKVCDTIKVLRQSFRVFEERKSEDGEWSLADVTLPWQSKDERNRPTGNESVAWLPCALFQWIVYLFIIISPNKI